MGLRFVKGSNEWYGIVDRIMNAAVNRNASTIKCKGYHVRVIPFKGEITIAIRNSDDPCARTILRIHSGPSKSIRHAAQEAASYITTR